MRKEILVAGSGWISSGLTCIVVWLVERGFRNATGLLWTGIIVIIVGAWLLLLNRSLEGTIVRFQKQAEEREARAKLEP